MNIMPGDSRQGVKLENTILISRLVALNADLYKFKTKLRAVINIGS